VGEISSRRVSHPEKLPDTLFINSHDCPSSATESEFWHWEKSALEGMLPNG